MPISSLGNYLFVSMNEDNLVGSIYYKNRRIRLVHKTGPKLGEQHTHILYIATRRKINSHSSFWTKMETKYGIEDKSVNDFIAYIDKSEYNDYKILDCSSQTLLDKIPFSDKMFHLINIRGWIHNNGYYLLEVYFDNFCKYSGRHRSRGCPVYKSISGQEEYLEKIYTFLEKRHQLSIEEKNCVVYALFYGYFQTYGGRNKPFDIHSPYKKRNE